MEEIQILIMFLGLFSIVVFWWDGIITKQEIDKGGIHQELNPIAKAWMIIFGVTLGLIITRVLATGMVLYFVFLEANSVRSLVLLVFISLFEAGLVGWNLSADYHIREIKKELLKKEKVKE
jgi:hypothetical protein